MHRKAVRRRRAVLGLLVALSLILLTAYFGESAGGGLHAVQRGALEVVSPIQEGASRALKPFRDFAGWFGDTLNAKSDRDKYRKEAQEYRRLAIANAIAARQAPQMRAMLNLDRRPELASYRKLTARVITRSPTVWYQTVNIDKGTGDGVRVNQPVINGDGLVGKVTSVTSGAAQVTLLTDHSSGVSAEVASTGADGLVQPAVGNPDDLLLDFVSSKSRLARGEAIVTAGTRSSRLESLFPPGIPIGSITRVDPGELSLYQRVHITPYASLRHLDFVQVLIPEGGTSAGLQASGP